MPKRPTTFTLFGLVAQVVFSAAAAIAFQFPDGVKVAGRLIPAFVGEVEGALLILEAGWKVEE